MTFKLKYERVEIFLLASTRSRKGGIVERFGGWKQRLQEQNHFTGSQMVLRVNSVKILSRGETHRYTFIHLNGEKHAGMYTKKQRQKHTMNLEMTQLCCILGLGIGYEY